MKEAAVCIYCPEPANSLEHPLPAAFGEFADAPYLDDRVCKACNNTRLGVLDEQFARCGPEGFLRRHYGVRGRLHHEAVNPFYRGSAGGQRLEFKAYDEQIGTEVLIECEGGVYRQVRQLIFVEKSGTAHHLPIREGTTPEQLRAAYPQVAAEDLAEVRLLCDDDERPWVEALISAASPKARFGWTETPGTTVYDGAVGTVVMTNRYFRAVAKIGFHYFLTQFPEYCGHESAFSDIREFILDEASTVDRANTFIGKRQLPLLVNMLDPRARPAGWRGHVLAAEVKDGTCLAHVQMFVSEDWPAPIYTVRLAKMTGVANRAAGHLYVYRDDRPNYAGDACRLGTTPTNIVAPPLTPAIQSS